MKVSRSNSDYKFEFEGKWRDHTITDEFTIEREFRQPEEEVFQAAYKRFEDTLSDLISSYEHGDTDLVKHGETKTFTGPLDFDVPTPVQLDTPEYDYAERPDAARRRYRA